MVVAPHPLHCALPNLVKVEPIILCQPFVANHSVEMLHIGIILPGLARLDVFDANSLSTGPVQRHGADVFRPVVTANHLWLATSSHDLLQGSNHVMRWQ